MASNLRVKICGISDPAVLHTAVDAGASYVGFVHFAKSPRHIDIGQMRDLAVQVPPGIAKVLLTVNADDALLDALTEAVPLDMLQLHGHETPEQVRHVRARYGLPVMKAIGIATADDLGQIADYATVADQLLLDAKPPAGADRPGGNAVAFDWELIAGVRWPIPWMLAGGLTPENVTKAVQLTHARQVDLSSGVESSPGVKDPARIKALFSAIKNGS